jgi:hypothetical protein
MPTEYSGGYATDRRRPSQGGRHRAPQGPSNTGRVLRSAGAVTAIVGSGLAVTATPAGAATADDFAKLRQCESGGNYAINTGNGFYGAYQFDTRTWAGLGYSGLPSSSPASVQDEAAHKLYNSRGWSPWPACSAKLGLTRNGPAPASTGGGSGVVEQAITPAEPPMTLDRARAEIDNADFPGTALSTDLIGEIRADALVWQAEMRDKGFVLTLDGRFGEQSRGIAQLYGYLTRVDDGAPGVVGQNIWNATVDS